MFLNSNTKAIAFSQRHIKALIFDISALAFIYLIPAISHMLSIKLYLFEPMRLMLILALVHTRKPNAYLLAVTLPLFSYFISSHPVFIKSGLIAIELSFMVFVFYSLVSRMHSFAAIFISIWASKLFYYGLKYLAIITVLPAEPLVGTPLLLQLGTSALFSLYVLFMFKNPTNTSSDKL